MENSLTHDARAPIARSSEALGRVTAVYGSQATVELAPRALGSEKATVGKFVGLAAGATMLVGMITEISEQATAASGQTLRKIARLDLLGEIRAQKFQRGVTEYPTIGDTATLLSERELRLVYGAAGPDHAHIGDLQQNPNINVHVDVDNLVSRHFAILGATGVGKSSGVVIILQKILDTRPNLRLFLVDPHNEYGRCFGEKAQVLNPRNLRLPFWLFNFEETVDAFFGGRPGVDEEVEILSEVIPLAKSAYLQYRAGTERSALAKKRDTRDSGFTADTPVPYRIEDLINLLDERMGRLENRNSRMVYHKLIGRIQTFRNHPRYAFMFENANIGGDTMAEILGNLFRLPPDGKPMTIMQLAGFPAEVVDSVVSVLCRMAFDFGLWSDGVAPLLFVCEEAHRYAPADKKIGFGPTRRALSRIAKEGRKYGVFLGLVTQRPAEIDATIISQCSTLFVMRMSNERDQSLIRSAVSDAAANLLSFIPRSARAKCSPSAPAWRCRRACASRNCRRSCGPTARPPATPAPMSARISTATCYHCDRSLAQRQHEPSVQRRRRVRRLRIAVRCTALQPAQAQMPAPPHRHRRARRSGLAFQPAEKAAGWLAPIRCRTIRSDIRRTIPLERLFPPDQIDQRRHADMAAAFLDGAVVLGDFERSEIGERVLQQRAGIKPRRVGRPASFVFELFQAIALHQQKPAGLERRLDAGKDMRALRRRGELDEDRRHHVEGRVRPVPMRSCRPVRRAASRRARRRAGALWPAPAAKSQREHVEPLLGHEHAVAPFAVGNRQRAPAFAQEMRMRLEEGVGCRAEQIARRGKALLPVGKFRVVALAHARPPKIALPTRTCVAPSEIATAKSALMPIDKSLSPLRLAILAVSAKCGARRLVEPGECTSSPEICKP